MVAHICHPRSGGTTNKKIIVQAKSKILSQKQPEQKRAEGMAQAVECLSSNPVYQLFCCCCLLVKEVE
jgi:hypothetical protein